MTRTNNNSRPKPASHATPNHHKARSRPGPKPRTQEPRTPEPCHEDPPVLRFTPTAWAKLQFLCHRGETEIGGFGITDPDDPLRIIEFATVKQRASAVSVSFDDEAVADFFEAQVDAGRRPSQFMRIWAHTHPGHCPEPSGTDEETFARVFGGCDWAVMFIVARGGRTYARLRFNVGPSGQVLLPVAIDYTVPFEAADHEAWEAEYERHIEVQPVGCLGMPEEADLHAMQLMMGDLDPAFDDDLSGAFDDLDYPDQEEVEI